MECWPSDSKTPRRASKSQSHAERHAKWDYVGCDHSDTECWERRGATAIALTSHKIGAVFREPRCFQALTCSLTLAGLCGIAATIWQGRISALQQGHLPAVISATALEASTAEHVRYDFVGTDVELTTYRNTPGSIDWNIAVPAHTSKQAWAFITTYPVIGAKPNAKFDIAIDGRSIARDIRWSSEKTISVFGNQYNAGFLFPLTIAASDRERFLHYSLRVYHCDIVVIRVGFAFDQTLVL